LEIQAADVGRQRLIEAHAKIEAIIKGVKSLCCVVENDLGLRWLNLSEENWDERNHKQIEDVNHEAHRDDTALERFKHILSVDGQADWLAKLVEALEPVKEAMPGFVFLVGWLDRSGLFSSFSLLHEITYERIKLYGRYN